MIIDLTKKEVSFAKILAKKRHNAKNDFIRNRGILMREGSVYDPHTIGVIGEMAYAKFSGEKIDETIYAIRDKGEDFNKIEVKTITYFGDGEPELKIKQKEFETKKPEIYILARVDKKNLASVELLGKISRENFNKHKLAKRYGRFNPDNWIVPLSIMEKL
jgi:tagatose-1,6-bisphosphate aldolase